MLCTFKPDFFSILIKKHVCVDIAKQAANADSQDQTMCLIQVVVKIKLLFMT